MEESRYYEDFYRKKYEENGYTMLNRGITGKYSGSCGGCRVKYTEEVSYEIAKKYTTLADFSKENPSCYARANLMGWVDNYTWLERRHTPYTYKECVGEMNKYKDKEEFRKQAPNYYNIMLRKGWLEPSQGIIWTEEKCREIAKKYEWAVDFRKNDSNAYKMAYKYGWLKKFTWLKLVAKPSGYWNKERVIEESKKYKTVKDFRKCSVSACSAAQRMGILDELTWLEREHVRNDYWTEERITEVAKKYTNISDFRENDSPAYYAASKRKLTGKFTWLKKEKLDKGSWDNKEFVMAKSKECQTLNEFRKRYSGGYKSALKNGWVDEMIWLKRRKNKKLS